tara:strand:+ start:2505 stop:2717 length:213 start_codon:yes stop_codon:yes gene_type:complete
MTTLNVNDLKSMISLIDVCTSRGAFKAQELEPIGKLYNKLNTFTTEMIQINTKEPSEPETVDETGGHSMG